MPAEKGIFDANRKLKSDKSENYLNQALIPDAACLVFDHILLSVPANRLMQIAPLNK